MIKKLFILAFIAALSLPLLAQILLPGRALSGAENRQTASLPGVPGSLGALQAWPRGAEAWMNDHFGLRGPMIRVSNRLSRRLVLEPGVQGQAIRGKDGWLFLANDHVITDYMGQNPFPSQTDALQYADALDRLHARLGRDGAKVLVSVIPNKSTIYPEFIPDYIPRNEGQSRLSQLSDALEERNSSVLVLKDALLQAKTEGQLYFRTDTHWTDLGAYFAYRTILSAWNEGSEAFRPRNLSDYKKLKEPLAQGDLLRLLGEPSDQPEMQVRLAPKKPVQTTREIREDYQYEAFKTRITTTANTKAPTLLIIGDSFSTRLMPFFEPHFSRIVLVHHQNGAFDPGLLTEFESDYVLVAFVERFLAYDWTSSDARKPGN